MGETPDLNTGLSESEESTLKILMREYAADQIKRLAEKVANGLVDEFNQVSAEIRSVRAAQSTTELKLLEGMHDALDTAMKINEDCLHQALEQLGKGE